MRWRDSAACAGADPELFFPAGYSGLHVAVVREAKRVCDACAVRVECLEFALATDQDEGVWGALTPDERRRLLRRRRRQRASAPV